MSIAEKLTQIAENEQKVYDSGYSKAEYDFWSIFTRGGKRKGYTRAFYDSGFKYINSPFKIVLREKSDASHLFTYSAIRKVDSKTFDFSQKALGKTTSDSYQWTFAECHYLEEVEDIGFRADEYGYMTTFGGCQKLHTIAVLRTSASTQFANNTFVYCAELVNLTIEGVIGQNSFNVQWSTKLSHDSLMSIINALADYSADTSGTTWTVTLGSENIAKLTEEEQLIAYRKGWNLA